MPVFKVCFYVCKQVTVFLAGLDILPLPGNYFALLNGKYRN
jgi:hypothetical protein